MAAKLPDVIDEAILSCPLCLRELQQPKVLPCLHLFCQHCLEEYITQTLQQEDTPPKQSQPISNQLQNEPPSGNNTRLSPPVKLRRQAPVNVQDGNALNGDAETPVEEPVNLGRNLRSMSPDEGYRGSSASDDSYQKKRFHQPERYTDRDSLVQHAQNYREMYQQRQSQLHSSPFNNQLQIPQYGKTRAGTSMLNGDEIYENYDVSVTPGATFPKVTKMGSGVESGIKTDNGGVVKRNLTKSNSVPVQSPNITKPIPAPRPDVVSRQTSTPSLVGKKKQQTTQKPRDNSPGKVMIFPGSKPSIKPRASVGQANKIGQDDEETLTLSGRVFNMINMYERKSQSPVRETSPKPENHSQDIREVNENIVPKDGLSKITTPRGPPLASFKSKPISQESTDQSFIPLDQRPQPLYVKRQLGFTGSRSQSFESPSKDLGLSELPRSISFTPESTVQKQTIPKRNKSESIENTHYEVCDAPESILRTKIPGQYRLDLTGRGSGIYELAKASDTLHRKSGIPLFTQREKSIDTSENHYDTIKLEEPKLKMRQKNCKKLSLDIGKSKSAKVSNTPSSGPTNRPFSAGSIRSRTPSTENIYDEIVAGHKSRLTSLSPSGSVPDLLDDIINHEEQHKHTRVRRNSTILDSYVTAGAFAALKKDNADDLNVKIPLSNDDSMRLSHMYMRMDGVSPPSKSRLFSQESYIDMHALESPDQAESMASILRSLSQDNSKKSGIKDAAEGVERQSVGTEPDEEPPGTPPIYMNLETVAIPVYDTPRPTQSIHPKKATSQPSVEKQVYSNGDIIIQAPNSAKTPDLKLPCPTCQRLFSLPNLQMAAPSNQGLAMAQQVAALKNCNFAAQMQEVVQTQKCEQKLCGHCEVKAAQYKCLDCQVYLCSGCLKGHFWSKFNRDHKVTTLQELQSGKYQQEIKQLQSTLCDVDKDNAARHYCGQCELLLCSECLLNHTPLHRHSPIGQVASRDQDFIQSAASSLRAKQETFQGAIDSMTNYSSHCETSREALLNQISEHHEFLKLMLDRSVDILKAKVIQQYEAELGKAAGVKQDISQSLNSMNHVARFVTQLLEHGNHGNIVSMATLVRQEFSRLQDKHPKVMESQLRMTYDPPQVSLKCLQPLIGDVTSASQPLSQCDVTRSKQSEELVEAHTHHMTLVRQFSTKVLDDQKGCLPNGMVVIPEEELVIVVDNINKKLKGFDLWGVLQWEVYPQGEHALIDPWDVTVLHNTDIAVTDKAAKNVKIFTRAGRFVLSFGPHLKMPWGICTNSRREIIVTDTELSCVFIHDAIGRLLHSLPHSGQRSEVTPLLCPEYVCTNQYDDLIVSDFESHAVVVYDNLGRQLFKFGKKGKGVEEFYHPLGVTTDFKGNIYVVNYNNRRITVLSRNGQFICCLTSQHGLHSLQALAISKQRHLVVTDGTKVKIFSLPQSIVGSDENSQSSKQRGMFLLNKRDSTDNSEKRLSVAKETSV